MEELGGCGPLHSGDGVHHLVEEDAGFYALHSGHDDLDPGGVAGGSVTRVCAGLLGEVGWEEMMFPVLVLLTRSMDLAEAFTLALEMRSMIFLSLSLPLSSMS